MPIKKLNNDSIKRRS